MHSITGVSPVAAVSVILLAVTGAGSALGDGPPAARVAEITRMLSDAPRGLGPPITDRATWERLAEREDYQAVVAAAEKLIDAPLPDQPRELYLDFSRTGNRDRWQRIAHERRKRIKTLALAECIEDRGRFLPAFRATAAALCAEPTWVYPAHDRDLGNLKGERIDIDLGSAYVGAELAAACHLLGPRLDAQTRDHIATQVHQRILTPFREMIRGERDANWWITTTNNWNAVCLAGVTAAALSLVDDPRERAFFVAAAEHSSRSFLRGFTPDGYCSEGLSYWNYGFGHYIQLAAMLERATDGRVNLLTRDAARQPARFAERFEIIGGVYPAFSDCPIGTTPDGRLTRYLSHRMRPGAAQAEWPLPDPRSGSLAQVLVFTFGPTEPLSDIAVGPGHAPRLRTWFDSAGVLICRPAGDSDPPFAVALKGGHNAEHHNHNDVGAFIVVAGDTAVLVDPGTEVYTARTFSKNRYDSAVLNSFGHPVPLVAGTRQSPGRQARGALLSHEFTDAHDSITFDLSSAYAVPALRRLEREFTYERGNSPSLTVTDTVSFAEPAAFEVALITFGQWRRTAPNLLEITAGEQTVRVELSTDGPAFEISATEIDEDVRAPGRPTRIGIRLAQPVSSAHVTMKITPVLDKQ